MDYGSLLLLLGLLILVGLYIGKPLQERTATAVSEEEHAYSSLLAERDRVLNTLQELDFDFALGKIPEESYPAERALLLQRGAAILRQIDEYQGGTGSDVDARLVAAIHSRRADSETPLSDDELEELIANRRRARIEKSNGFCPQCGNPIQQSDRFCPKCGTALS